jgi:meiosis-specific protein HOP1
MLTTYLDCDVQTAAKLIKHLKNEGFLVRTPGANKAGFKKTGKPTWGIVENGPERARMMNLYFDPTTKIAHHVSCLS